MKNRLNTFLPFLLSVALAVGCAPGAGDFLPFGPGVLAPTPSVSATTTPAAATRLVPTGGITLVFEDETLVLSTYLDEEGNTAAWTTLPDRVFSGEGFGLYLVAFPDEDLTYWDAATLIVRLASLDGPCPCVPEDAELRYFLHGTNDAELYRSIELAVTIETLEALQGGQLRVAGRFNGVLAYYETFGGDPDLGDQEPVEGTFEALAERFE